MFEAERLTSELSEREVQRLERNLNDALERNLHMMRALTLIRDHGGDYASGQLADSVLRHRDFDLAVADFHKRRQYERKKEEEAEKLKYLEDIYKDMGR